MQTFLPFPNFEQSARCLDYRRLGKQRVEAYQILNTLQGKSTAWANHPAVVMWRGYDRALTNYKNICIAEWVSRGYRNEMPVEKIGPCVMPPWFGDRDFHDSHKSMLFQKDPVNYQQFKDVRFYLDYAWPL